jgi:hypothetical protein
MAGMKPKLTLRKLFWLVLVCAVLAGWFVDHRDKTRGTQAGLEAGYCFDEIGWSQYILSPR